MSYFGVAYSAILQAELLHLVKISMFSMSIGFKRETLSLSIHTHTHTHSVIKTQRNKTIQGGEIKKIFREEEKFKLELKILH